MKDSYYTGKYTCYYCETETETVHDTKEAAMVEAAWYAGNNVCARVSEEMYLYGPGDGTTSIIVSRQMK